MWPFVVDRHWASQGCALDGTTKKELVLPSAVTRDATDRRADHSVPSSYAASKIQQSMSVLEYSFGSQTGGREREREVVIESTCRIKENVKEQGSDLQDVKE